MVIGGTIDEIRFRNDENGFTIVVLDCEGEPVICVGTFPPVYEGEGVSLAGEFTVHPKFGKQFKVSRVEASRPNTVDGIIRYLGSGLIHGIGPKLALAIGEAFGANTFEVIKNAPERLATIRGISKSKAQEIAMRYGQIESMQKTMVFLQGHGIPLGTSLKIFKEYGEDTVTVLTQNPYRLVEEVDGIGFITADRIAEKLGVEKNSSFRLRAGILYTLKDGADKNGNTYLPYETLCDAAAKLLDVEREQIVAELDDLMVARRVKVIETEDESGGKGVMLPALFRAEKGIAQRIVELLGQTDRTPRDYTEALAEFERGEGIELHPVQREAVRTAASGSVTVITGGPGTGKTTIVKCILSVFDSRGIKAALMAPTGRAAKRMSESCGRDASTIHRALMIGHEGEGGADPIAAGAVIVDEFSMVDVYLFHTLLKRLPPSCKLILVGDADQLPSVGAGNVLKDLLASSVVPFVRLERIYRQRDESLIVENAHLVNDGKLPLLDKKDGDFFYCAAESAEDIADLTVGLAAERIPKFLGVEPYRVQVLCPVKAGAAGSANLNRRLQRKLNEKGGAFVESEDCRYITGDKVMHVANNYNLGWRRIAGGTYETGEGVFNGDLGVISEVRPDSGEIDVLFEDGRLVTYTPDLRSQLMPAYAITVHKSQGSEFDGVILPLYGLNPVLMTRNLLYTAITRAKRAVVLVGERYTIKRMVENDYVALRYSALQKFLGEAFMLDSLLFGNDEEDDGEGK